MRHAGAGSVNGKILAPEKVSKNRLEPPCCWVILRRPSFIALSFQAEAHFLDADALICLAPMSSHAWSDRANGTSRTVSSA